MTNPTATVRRTLNLYDFRHLVRGGTLSITAANVELCLEDIGYPMMLDAVDDVRFERNRLGQTREVSDA